jgi:hypothetical protein
MTLPMKIYEIISGLVKEKRYETSQDFLVDSARLLMAMLFGKLVEGDELLSEIYDLVSDGWFNTTSVFFLVASVFKLIQIGEYPNIDEIRRILESWLK